MASETATVYARALFDLATMTDTVDAADAALDAAVKAVRGHVDLREALNDTGVPAEKKRAIVRDVFGEGNAAVVAIVGLMVDNGHTDQMGDVAAAFSAIAEKERGIVVAEVTTAVELTDALRESIKSKLSAELGRPVSLREKVDASIVGGVVIKVAGKVVDGSVSARLDHARRALVTGKIGGEA